jgi:PTS system ascorbate-specific IIA component
MVIFPNFALAHAAPSEEVIKDDTALITLEKPVLFGSPNDPVYVILAICSKDGKSHMDSLAQIASMLMRENMITRLIEAKNVEEILNIIEKHLSI